MSSGIACTTKKENWKNAERKQARKVRDKNLIPKMYNLRKIARTPFFDLRKKNQAL